ncbi:DUF4010 domain-containing protein [Methyloceanibacter sp. wino2]|uniref:MgtC/SapB family protein n=1 Tax=Methyloceanibacter sp. wino2 TaxID=2170729 RepID=UPI000D3E106A|nr:DUF4010 domain-containing protein [Methyloceanibacter sp. wino2]
MEPHDLMADAIHFGIAVLLGALVGIEREKHRRERKSKTEQTAGLRTFILFALLGACTAWLARLFDSYWIVAAGLLITGAFVVAGYIATTRGQQEAVGLTTEVAAVIVFVLGAIDMLGGTEIAIALAVITTAVLAYKDPMHGFVKQLGWDDVYSGLQLLIATFIALPLLPDKPIDPWGALNPYELWLLVILISGLSLVGYAMTRWLGPGKGALLTGFAGGLVASTAVTVSFAREARTNPANTMAFASGILVAWAVMFVRVLVVVAVVNRALLGPIFVPFAAMALVAAGSAGLIYLRRHRNGKDVSAREDLRVTNPFSVTSAAKFAAFFAVVLVAVKIAQENFSDSGVYAVAALAGLTDVDAITLSMAELAKTGSAHVAVIAIVIASLVNTAVKCGIAFVLGGVALGKPLLLAIGAMLVAGLASVLLI